MLFSVLIAHYNNARFLTHALNSVLAQSYTNWEIIIVDDGSVDNFEAVITPYAHDGRINIYRNEKNYGCAYAKRKCASLATGEVLAFLDPDDALTPDALEILVKAHEQYPTYSIVHSTHFICDETLLVKRIADYPRALPADTPYLLLNDGSIHHFASFKKALYDQTEKLSDIYHKAVDQDLYYKMEETGGVLFIDKPLYYYRIHKGGISTEGKEWEATIWHYAVIKEACLRRIKQLRKSGNPQAAKWIKQYRTRYYKISIFHSFRTRNWFGFLYSSVVFVFTGGFSNVVSYLKKLPRERMQLLKRSFASDHQIKA